MNNPSAQTNTGTGGGGGVGDLPRRWCHQDRRQLRGPVERQHRQQVEPHGNLHDLRRGTVASGSPQAASSAIPAQSKIEHGNTDRTDGAWWQVYNGNQTSQWHFYALSDPLTVVAGGPDTDPPVLVSTDPADNSTGFPVNIRWSRPSTKPSSRAAAISRSGT